jgi:hypothetical protein
VRSVWSSSFQTNGTIGTLALKEYLQGLSTILAIEKTKKVCGSGSGKDGWRLRQLHVGGERVWTWIWTWLWT